ALRLTDGKYLLEHYAVSYVSNGRDLMPHPPLPLPVGPALVLADPDYDDLGQPGPEAPRGPAGAQRSGALLQQGPRFARLPGFAAEAAAVARLLQGQPGWKLELKQGRQADEETL